jgi:general secretion pathway protein G
MQLKTSQNKHRKSQIQGYTLLELIVTLTVLAILVLGTIPMAQNAVKRQREMRLRESLRMMRNAIDEFKRDAFGACPQGAVTSQNPQVNQQVNQQGANAPSDPRSRVMIDDCKIFSAENLDRYPPDLETLVKGVSVRSRGLYPAAQQGGAFSDKNATELNENVSTTKVYLREIPKDITGNNDTWVFQSSYQTADSNWDQINVFDVRSGSDEEALNGEKYNEW